MNNRNPAVSKFTATKSIKEHLHPECSIIDQKKRQGAISGVVPQMIQMNKRAFTP